MTKSLKLLTLASALLATLPGCRLTPHRNPDLEAHLPPAHKIPNEEVKTTLPPYIIEPPDVLLIDAIKVVPKSPYLLEPLDIIRIDAENVLPDYPLEGNFQIESDGTVKLGTQYGSVSVEGMTIEDATDAITRKLQEELRDPIVSVVLAQTTGVQQISGQHLVTPTGTVNLGTYGEVYVAGLTLMQAKEAIEKHLEQYLEAPRVMVDVFAYNSKVYYVVTDGSGLGDRVVRLPIVGGETVLDAISQLGGLAGTSTKDIWLARPAPDDCGLEQRLPVDWNAITRHGITATNYQIFPGDRLYIRGSAFTLIDATIAKFTQPIERVSGVMLLGSGTIRNLNQSFRRSLNGGLFQ